MPGSARQRRMSYWITLPEIVAKFRFRSASGEYLVVQWRHLARMEVVLPEPRGRQESLVNLGAGCKCNVV